MSSLRAGDAGDRLPRGAVALEVADTSAASMMSCSSAYRRMRRDEPAVLADLVEHRVGGAGEHDVLVDARRPRRRSRTRPNRNSSISGSHARKRGQARVQRGAALLAVAAVAGRVALLDLERLVDALVVAVAEHVVRAHDDAARAPGAQPGRHDLVVEVLPRVRPTLLLLGRWHLGDDRRGAWRARELHGRWTIARLRSDAEEPLDGGDRLADLRVALALLGRPRITQWRRCSSSRPSPTPCSALVTDAIWVSTSMQYSSSSIIRCEAADLALDAAQALAVVVLVRGSSRARRSPVIPGRPGVASDTPGGICDVTTEDDGDEPRTTHRDRRRVDLPIEGMTCASCAARIEKALAGARRASTTCRGQLRLRARDRHLRPARGRPRRARATTVADLGYSVPGPTAPRPTPRPTSSARRADRCAGSSSPSCSPSRCCSSRWCPPFMFDGWQWVAFVLATPVDLLVRAGRSTAPRSPNLRHGAVTMDTLVSIGTLAAWTVVGRRAAVPRRGRRSPAWQVDGGHCSSATASAHVYFETGAVIITLLLLGRCFEARARRRSSDALRALARARREDRAARERRRDRRSRASRSATASSCARARRSPPTVVVVDGASAVDVSMLTGEPVPGRRRRRATRCSARRSTPSGRLVVEATRVGQRHRARADRPARRGGAGLEGAGAAARRPDLRRLRAGRARRSRSSRSSVWLLDRRTRPTRRSPPRSRC